MPHNAVVFPYGIALREGGTVDTFPAAEVRFPLPDGEWLSLIFIIDSGATISALPGSDAPALEVPLTKGARFAVSGVNGEMIAGWKHELSASLGGHPLLLPAVFLETDTAPRVLGREGVFDRFTVVFEERRRRSGFFSAHTPQGRAITKMLDRAGGRRGV